MMKKLAIMLIVLFLAGCGGKELMPEDNVENYRVINNADNVNIEQNDEELKVEINDTKAELENKNSSEIKDSQQKENHNENESKNLNEKQSKTEKKDNSVNNNQSLSSEKSNESTNEENQEKVKEEENNVEEVKPKEDLSTKEEVPKENNEEYLNWKKIHRYSSNAECLKACNDVAKELYSKGINFKNLMCSSGVYGDEVGYELTIFFLDGTNEPYTT